MIKMLYISDIKKHIIQTIFHIPFTNSLTNPKYCVKLYFSPVLQPYSFVMT